MCSEESVKRLQRKYSHSYMSASSQTSQVLDVGESASPATAKAQNRYAEVNVCIEQTSDLLPGCTRSLLAAFDVVLKAFASEVYVFADLTSGT
jgi:hypothetical protein